ncbi:MAG TPA: nucleotide exchange factor GrpE [Patescibacteria group bacterium]|nr:nucleotide exchange factor GrpE [Patescibacteria group bacterium]
MAQSNKPKTTNNIKQLHQQIVELTEALQRERADAENIRRRHDEQIGGLKNMVTANVVQQLLPVIDNFERALKHVPEDLKNNDYVKGVGGVVKQFEKTLADMGVERIQTVGKAFDPRLHEAISMDGEHGSHEVVSEELQSGYVLGDNVLRHSMVKVRMEDKKS